MSKSGLLLLPLLVALTACEKSNADSKKDSATKATTDKSAVKSISPGKPDAVSSVNASSLTENQKLSYALGVQMGLGMRKSSKQNQLNKIMDIELMTQGIKDSFSGKKLAMTPQQLQAVVTQYKVKMIAKQKAELVKHTKEHDDYFAKVKTTKGIVEHKSGLMYKVAATGKGVNPKPTDTVQVHYTILTTSSKLLFSSKAVGRPINIVPGKSFLGVFKVALPLMKKGSKWNIHAPAKLLFGSRGRPPQIKPMQALVLNIEVLEINPKPAKLVLPKTTTKEAPKKK